MASSSASAPSPPRVFAHGTPLTDMKAAVPDRNDAYSLSVASFNLLADAYVRPRDKRTGDVQPFATFEWISDTDTAHVLDMRVRGPRLLAALQNCAVDVVCLQELQLERSSDSPTWKAPAWMGAILQDYTLHLPPAEQLGLIAARNVRVLDNDAAVTCAILYRTDRLESVVAPTAATASNARGSKNKYNKDSDTTTGVTLGLRPKHTPNAATVVISSLHLDANDEAKRVRQLSKCLHQAKRYTTAEAIVRPISTILAGDLNTECWPGSCVAAFLTNTDDNFSNLPSQCSAAPDRQRQQQRQQCADAWRVADESQLTVAQWNAWMALLDGVHGTVRDLCLDLHRVPTGATRAAYDHNDSNDNDNDDMATTSTPRRTIVTWRLDHILYTPTTLQPFAYWSTLEADAEALTTGLPNGLHGSDHLSIAAVFRVLPPPRLSDQAETALLDRLHVLRKSHATHLQELLAKLDVELESIQGHSPPLQWMESQPGRKPKKKKASPPPPLVQDFMRRKRSTVRDLKARHETERLAFVAELGNLERLLVEREVGCPAYEWVSNG